MGHVAQFLFVRGSSVGDTGLITPLLFLLASDVQGTLCFEALGAQGGDYANPIIARVFMR